MLKLNFGIHMPTHGMYGYKEFLNTSLLAEELGYDYITIGDHFFLSPEFHKRVGDDPNRPHKLDAWTVLAALAAQTERAKLGTRVSPIPFYQPSRLAKVVTTVDIISGGRAILGAGAAGYRDEAVAYGVWWGKHEERIERMVEGLEIILKLWKEDRATLRGKYHCIVDAPFWPKPVQKPHPPIWFGGSGDSLVNAAAKYGEGIFPPPDFPPERLKHLNRRLREAEKKQGRKSRVKLAPSLIYPDGMGKTPTQWLQNTKAHAEIGASLILIDLAQRSVSPEEAEKFLKSFSRSVFTEFKGS